METRELADRMAYAGPMWVQTEEDVWSSTRAMGVSVAEGPVLCIASGGCTALGMLRAGAEHVVAVDINPAQLDVVRLKLGCLASLRPDEFFEMWTSRSRVRRLEFYERVRESVRGVSSSFDGWMLRIPDGVELVDAGGMEGVGSELRQEDPELHRELWGWIESGVSVGRPFLLDAAREIAARRQGRSVRLFPAGSGPDPAVGEEMERHFVKRFEVLLNELPTQGNPYLAHAVLGTYPTRALLDYFRKSSSEALRGAESKVNLVRSDLADAVEGMDAGFLAGADISNVGDFLPKTEWDRVFAALERALRPGAVVVHRNFVWDEPYPVSDGFWRDEVLSSSLHKRDRSFIYRAVTVDRREG